MRYVLFFFMLLISLSAFSQIDTATFLKDPQNKNKVLKSLNSGLCHPPASQYRSRVTIAADQSNVYDSLDACIASGGELPAALKNKIGEEDPIKAEEITKTEANSKLEQERQTQFAGLNWGAGLAFAVYNHKYIRDVTIENGTVRVNHEVNNSALAMLESHYFFTVSEKFAHGPFVSIGLVGEDGIDPLSVYGLGWMIGFRRPHQGTSWNVGIGYFIDSETETLRPGLSDGGTTTETDPTKLLRKSDEGGIMFMFSANL